MGELLCGAFRSTGVRAAGSPVWDRQRRLWWLLWSRCPGLGWQRLRALEVRFGGLPAAWEATSVELAGVAGFGSELVAAVLRFRGEWGPRPLQAFAPHCRFGRGVLLPGDPHWPEGMGQLHRPPLQLCWRGGGALWPHLGRRRSVAVVGTRRPSLHGLSMARSISAALAEAGWPVLSGLAEGIDGAAHEGCLAAGGRPVAVLGTPLERVYPRHHGPLQSRVAREGLLVSELPMGGAVRRGCFAARNRLLVAMAAALVVVECPAASGALHSAELAWQLGLPLWVVPADAGRASALGSNRLLARGATPLLQPEDLISQLGAGPLAARKPPGDPGDSGRPPEAEGLLAAVGAGASLEQLSLALDQPMAALMPLLLELELAGLLQAEAGLCWRPC